MTEWKRVKIGELFNIEKGVLQSSKCEQGKYPFITAATEWKTHSQYSHDCEALIYAVAASGSLGRVHYIKGKFISSDLCFILTEKNHNEYPIDYKFYHLVFEFMRDEIVSATKTGTSKESINRKNFSEYEIPYIPFEKQKKNVDLLVNAKKSTESFFAEITEQKALIKKLRQSILQDAIEGKLTEDWRKENPLKKGDINFDVDALFEKVQEEKDKQEKGSKKKKDNGKLQVIGDDEKMFEIPESWKWVRLGEICNSITDGEHQPPPKVANGIPFLVISDISNGKINFKGDRYVPKEYFDSLNIERKPEKRDILYTVAGSYGIPVIVPDFKFCIQRHIGIIKISEKLCSYLFYVLQSPICKKQADKTAWGVAVKTIPINSLRNYIIPLPPLAEQNEIVRRVENQLAKVEQLEQQVQERENLTKSLFRGILKNAFEGR